MLVAFFSLLLTARYLLSPRPFSFGPPCVLSRLEFVPQINQSVSTDYEAGHTALCRLKRGFSLGWV
jgi:hypothetical protein